MQTTEIKQPIAVLCGQIQGGYLIMVLLLMTAYLLTPAGESTVGAVFLAILLYSAIAIGVSASVHRTLIRVPALAVVFLGLVAAIIAGVKDLPLLDAATRSIGIALLVFTVVAVLAGIVRVERVTQNTVFGAIGVYLLLGMGWAIAYTLIDQASTTAFSPSGVFTESPGAAAYFSLITQTTLGYGDITPAAGYPRMMAAVQAVVGQVFLVITVARLVGLQVAYSGRGAVRAEEGHRDV